MLRLGVSLPALMQLLGHKDIHMTLLYLDVTQQDLQREFHCARQKAASLHPIPKLPLPQATTPERIDLPAIRNAIAVVRHLLQLFHLELQDPNARRKLRRLSQRLLTLSHVLITSPKNECTLASQLMEGVEGSRRSTEYSRSVHLVVSARYQRHDCLGNFLTPNRRGFDGVRIVARGRAD
jgi:hypothetical protein